VLDAVKLDGDEIKAARIHDTVKLYRMAEAALRWQMEAVVGDLPNAETKQRLSMFARKGSKLFHQIACWILPRQDKVSLIRFQPNQLVFAGLGREIPLDDLTIETSLSRHQASDARRNKEASSILHESTCRTT
jgi:hypothetical protein